MGGVIGPMKRLSVILGVLDKQIHEVMIGHS